MTYIHPFSEILQDRSLLQKFVHDLKMGAVAAIPTDTLYGFAVDAESEAGVAAVYRCKSREEAKPLILFSDSLARLEELGLVIGEQQRKILEKCWPGGLTGVFRYRLGAMKGFSHPTIGVRIPNQPELLAFLREYPGFLLTTSANVAGKPPLFSPGEIIQEFGEKISWIVDGGQLPLSEPSTVADMTTWPPVILRQGKVCL